MADSNRFIAGRSTALVLLGEEPVWDKEKSGPYSRDSEPINAEVAYPLEQLVDDLDTCQERLQTALDRITAEELAIKKDDRTLGERLSFSYWHEAYHTGQTELLRQLAGTDDKII